MQGAVETIRAELDRAESDAAAAEERVTQIKAELAQVSEEHDTSNEHVVALETELQQAHEEKQAAEGRVVQERRNLAQNEARLNATQRFAEATFARQQESASQDASEHNVEFSEQDTLDTGLNQDQGLDNGNLEKNFRVNPETLTKNNKSEGFTDEVIGEGSQPVPSMPNGAEDLSLIHI